MDGPTISRMSAVEEEERRAKQTYLRSEIIESGFDASAFVEHLNALKPNGDDVDEWTLEELTDAVTQFKLKQKSVLETVMHEPGSDSTPGSKRTSSLSSSKRILSESQMAALEENKRRATLQGFVLEASDDELEEEKNVQELEQPEDAPGYAAAVETSAFEASEDREKRCTDETSIPVQVELETPAEKEAERRGTTQIKPQGTEKVELCSTKEFDIILECGKTPLTELACEKSVRTSIVSTRIVKGGFFTPDYLSYTVVTKPVGYKVERRFNDFFWLRERLLQDYPGQFIPPIAKKTGGRSFEESFLKRRQDTLQQFLDCISDHEELRSSMAFSSFAKFDGETFTTQKESLEKMAGKATKLTGGFTRKLFEGQQRLRVADLNTKSGEARCRIDHNTNKYAEYSEKLVKVVHENYVKLRGLSEELIKDFEKTADTLSRVSAHLASMSKIHVEFNDVFQEGKWEGPRKVYDCLGTALGKWGESFKKTSKIFRTNIIRSIKYSRKECDILEAYLKYRHDASNEAYLAAQALDSRKDILFATGDISKWELNQEQVQGLPDGWTKNKQIAKTYMLPEATSNLKELRLCFGYINGATVEQSGWLGKARAKRYVGCIQGFCSELAELFDVVDSRSLSKTTFSLR